MLNAPNELLVEAYYKAKKLQLDPDFIALIKKELSRRKLIVL